jgi:hypothetical protein
MAGNENQKTTYSNKKMKTTYLKTLGTGIAALALTLVLATSAQASIVITQQGAPVISGSWTVNWLASGGTFDEIVGTVLAGDQFENSPTPGMASVPPGWTSLPGVGAPSSTASISDGAVNSLLYSTTFTGSSGDLPPELINFQVFDANVLVGQETLLWTGNEFDVVPEPTTMIAGALLLLPFGASAFRILRRNRIG